MTSAPATARWAGSEARRNSSRASSSPVPAAMAILRTASVSSRSESSMPPILAWVRTSAGGSSAPSGVHDGVVGELGPHRLEAPAPAEGVEGHRDQPGGVDLDGQSRGPAGADDVVHVLRPEGRHRTLVEPPVPQTRRIQVGGPRLDQLPAPDAQRSGGTAVVVELNPLAVRPSLQPDLGPLV